MHASSGAAHRMHLAADGRRLCVALEGELDMANADSVTELATTVDGRYDEVVFDLSRLTFVDSSGLNALVKVRKAGVPLVVRGASPAVRRVMDIVGITEYLNVT